MKKMLYISLVIVASTMVSCRTYQYTSRQTTIKEQNIEVSPTIVDIQVDYQRRITVTSKRCWTQTEAMQEARYLAIVDNKIDVLVDPIYKIEHHGLKFQVSLSGFAGTFVNSRTLNEDIKQLKDISREDIEKYLILHQPEVLKYMNANGEIVNIYHGGCTGAKKCDAPAPAPAPKATPVAETTTKTKRK